MGEIIFLVVSVLVSYGLGSWFNRPKPTKILIRRIDDKDISGKEWNNYYVLKDGEPAEYSSLTIHTGSDNKMQSFEIDNLR